MNLLLDDAYIEKMANFYCSEAAQVIFPYLHEITFEQWLYRQYHLKFVQTEHQDQTDRIVLGGIRQSNREVREWREEIRNGARRFKLKIMNRKRHPLNPMCDQASVRNAVMGDSVLRP